MLEKDDTHKKEEARLLSIVVDYVKETLQKENAKPEELRCATDLAIAIIQDIF